MKKIIYFLTVVFFLASCGDNKKGDNSADLVQLKKQRAELDAKIKKLEENKKDSVKSIPVSVTELAPQDFHGYVEVQGQINCDDNIMATPKAPGTVKALNVVVGQHVNQGQVLATLDASAIEQQIEAAMPQLNLLKSVFEKQQNLWEQNIGTEIQLMTAKAQYDAALKQIEALKTQRDMYRIVAPISGSVDDINIKVGDFANPGVSGIRVVNKEKLKAEANLGQNYLGKVKQGDPVVLILPDIGDTIKTKLSHVSQAVDVVSRAFNVQIMLGNNVKLHPNMSCILRIMNYENTKALVVPIAAIQKTSNGEMIYIADGNVAKSVYVTTGENVNGNVEILKGLSAGDKVITTGYEELDNGESIKIQ